MFASLIFVFAILPLSFANVSDEDESIASLSFEKSNIYCNFPPYPVHGSYKLRDYPFAVPGDQNAIIVMDISCDTGYKTNNGVQSMLCINGHWSGLMPICVQDLPASDLAGQHRQLEGKYIQELPWHVSIYEKSSEDYNAICGGTLISTTKAITTATFFHDHKNKLRPASDFVVAGNKTFYKYKDSRDSKSQYSDVIDIKVNARYWGINKNYSREDNVAIVVVRTPFILHQSLIPMVLDFDPVLDSAQLSKGNFGKTVRWSWSEADGESESLSLSAINVEYIEREHCKNMLPTYRRPYLTVDKFCTIYNNVTWPLTPDVGNGLFFFDSTSQRYYLRGIYTDLEIAKDGKTVIIMYTSIVKNENLILNHL